jgi:dimethylargininase
MHLFSRAIVRAPASSFADGLTTSGALGRPDLRKARAQHAAYCRALADCGLALTEIEPDDAFPDSTFVEDTALIADRVTVITRPGAASRRGETDAVESVLRRFRPRLEHIDPPGTVDGGDVCQVGEHFLIGVSARTNEHGAEQLAAILSRYGYTSSSVDIRGNRRMLHLKSGMAYLGDGLLVQVAGCPRILGMADHRVFEVAAAEAYAANCLLVNDWILVASGFPQQAAALQARGYRLRPLDMSEFRMMDGGLSCLSLRF